MGKFKIGDVVYYTGKNKVLRELTKSGVEIFDIVPKGISTGVYGKVNDCNLYRVNCYKNVIYQFRENELELLP